jgi:hypothetical protein
MLDVNPDTVRRLMALARELYAREAQPVPDEPSSSEAGLESLLSANADDTMLREFRSVVDDLEPDQQQQVVALLWLGRGDYSLEEWQDAVERAADAWNPTTADYLLMHPLLADHLAEGLEIHGVGRDEE